MSKLDELAAEVAEDQQAIEVDTEDVRTRVKRMGKKLLKMQKEQKKEQDKTGQTWKEWCQQEKMARPSFPEHSQCIRYCLIATYPGAYQKGMTIKEAYKAAGQWKANGGNPPEKEKVTVSSRRLVTIGRMSGKLDQKLEKLLDNFDQVQEDEGGWSMDEMIGCQEELTLIRTNINALSRKLNALISKEDSHATK